MPKIISINETPFKMSHQVQRGPVLVATEKHSETRNKVINYSEISTGYNCFHFSRCIFEATKDSYTQIKLKDVSLIPQISACKNGKFASYFVLAIPYYQKDR